MSGTMNKANIAQIASFLKFLDTSEKYFTFMLLDDTGHGVPHGCGCLNLRVEEIEDLLDAHPGSTLHVTLNQCDDKGRRTANVKSCRVLCVDLDREVSDEELAEIVEAGNSPHLIVNSSPKKYHLYWQITGISLEEWKVFQLGLAHKFNGDLNLAQITKTIRVPGVERITKSGEMFMPSVVWTTGAKEMGCRREDILALFPWIIESHHEALVKVKEERQALRELIKAQGKEAGAELGASGVFSTVSLVGRNNALYSELRSAVTKLSYTPGGELLEAPSEGELTEYGLGVNNLFPSPLELTEVEAVVRSAYRHGIEARERRISKIKERSEEIDSVMGELDNVVVGDFTVGTNGAGGATNGTAGASVNGVTSSTNGVKSDDLYPYSFKGGDHFSDSAVLERIHQRFGAHLTRVGTVVYAFDDADCLWRPQKEPFEVVESFVKRVIGDTVRDPLFIPSFCLDSAGVYSEAKFHRARDRFYSHTLTKNTMRAVVASNRVRRAQISEYDQVKHLLFCGNGVLDMSTGELATASAKDMLLQKTEVRWDASASYSWWEEFLGQVFARNGSPSEMIAFMKRLFGYSLTGSVREQKVFVHYGLGANGKSKVLTALGLIAGGYTTRLDGSTLSKSKNALAKEFNRIGAKLEGKRVAIIDDLDTQTQWNEGYLKMLTGTSIPCRRLYEEERDIPNRAKFHIGCNEYPKTEGEGLGLIRRLCTIHYNNTFEPDGEMDAMLEGRIQEHSSGILRWSVEGFTDYVTNGMGYPQEVKDELQEYREDHFHVENVVEDLFSKGEEDSDWHPIGVLLDLVNTELARRGAVENSVSKDRLGKLLTDKMGCEKVRLRTKNNREVTYKVKILTDENGLSPL